MPGAKLKHPGRNFLFTPGPTHIPNQVMTAMIVDQEDHRAPDFPELVSPLLKDLNKIFKSSKGQSFIFPATGTAGWEIALANTLSPGDKILTSRFGQFSHLWYDLAKRIGLDVEVIDVTWGEGVPVAEFKKRLRADKQHKIKAIIACHNETATGVTSDIGALGKAIKDLKHPALYMVDGVSSVASIDFRMDEWHVDVCVSGSQKGFMLPAGMALLCFSQRALAARKTSTCPKCFLDIQDHINANKDGFFPYTPSIPMLRGLRASIDMLLEEGLDNVHARHFRLAEGVRKAVKAWGLKPCAAAPKWNSDTVTAILTPPKVNAAEVIHIAYHRYNISLGAGLSQVAGKVFRIGHLGDNNDVRMMAALGGVEMAMRDAGIRIKPGSGVGAAVEYYRSTAKDIPAFKGAPAAPALTKKKVAKKKQPKKNSS
jgi:alanine-glyoxylate transaminase/serine-glyoxylate transaminase/serine-pyruvate transaminase